MTTRRDFLRTMPELAARQRRIDLLNLSMALIQARRSKDPRTQVGSVIIGPLDETRSTGRNGFPRGIKDTPERWADQTFCDKCVVHAERNAILAAARVGVPLAGCTLYLIATDDSNAVWGGPPCIPCAMEIIQAGITETVAFPFKTTPSRWADEVKKAGELLAEAGVVHREISHATAQEIAERHFVR